MEPNFAELEIIVHAPEGKLNLRAEDAAGNSGIDFADLSDDGLGK